MRKLLEVLGKHLPAVERDLIVAGYHLRDIPSKLSWIELTHFVAAAPPGSATRNAIDGGWSKTEELLATLIEALTGNAVVKGRFDRPGVSPEDVKAGKEARRQHAAPKKGGKQFLKQPDLMTVSEFEAAYAKQQAQWKAAEAG